MPILLKERDNDMTDILDRKYRKKPVVIEATQWFKNGDHPDDNPDQPGWEGKVVRYFRRPEPEYSSLLTHAACPLVLAMAGSGRASSAPVSI